MKPPTHKNHHTSLVVAVAAAITVLLTASAHAQLPPGVVSYTVSRPIQDGMSLRFREYEQSGGFTVYFTNLTVNAYMDTVNARVRLVGFVSCRQNTNAVVYTTTRSVAQPFPNPPLQVTGTVTVRLALRDGGLCFDTGYQALTWDQTIGQYTFDGHVFRSIPVVGSYDLLTGGNAYTGNFAYPLNEALGLAFTFGRLSTANYPSSLALSALGWTGGMFSYASGVDTAAEMTASNGFPVRIQPGQQMWGLFNGESFDWSFGAQQQLPGGAGVDYTPVTALPGEAPLLTSITSQPTNVTAQVGRTVNFTVGVAGHSPFHYQWLTNGVALSGATNSTLVLTNVQLSQAGSYSVVVSNCFNIVTSSNATLTVILPPVPQTSIHRAVRLDHSNLEIGASYQLQQSLDLTNWTNFGTPFSATSSTNSQYVDVENWNLFFRLKRQ